MIRITTTRDLLQAKSLAVTRSCLRTHRRADIEIVSLPTFIVSKDLSLNFAFDVVFFLSISLQISVSADPAISSLPLNVGGLLFKNLPQVWSREGLQHLWKSRMCLAKHFRTHAKQIQIIRKSANLKSSESRTIQCCRSFKIEVASKLLVARFGVNTAEYPCLTLVL